MDGKLFIDADLDADSASGSHWLSEMTKSKEKQGGKRKTNQKNNAKIKIARSKNSSFSDLKKMSAQFFVKPECELKENCPESDVKGKRKRKRKRFSKKMNNRRPFSHHTSSGNGQNKDKNYPGLDLTDVFQEVRNKSQLTVCCGKITGCLYREKYDNGDKCILSKGQWFTPRRFEMFGGKANYKKWKVSIHYKTTDGFQVQLQKLIQNGCLSEFGQLRESFEQTDRDNMKSVQNLSGSTELIDSLNGFPESWKRLFSKTLEVSLCRNENNAVQKETTQLDSSSDESVSVAERVKMNRRESVTSSEIFFKTITEAEESTSDHRDSSASPAAVPEPVASSVLEEADLSAGVPADGGSQRSFTASPAEWQNPVDHEQTPTGQREILTFLADQFNTINDTLKSIDLSLKKLVEAQSRDALPQSIRMTPALIENSRIHLLVKEEHITELVEK